MKCRHCNSELNTVFIDLHHSPLANDYLTAANLDMPETYYPLKLFVCETCKLVQIDEYKKAGEIFNDSYGYFSSFSSSWVDHAKNYTEMMVDRFKLSRQHFIVEIASNDGYLLQFFTKRGFNVLGIEPSANTAFAAKEKGIETLIEYFGTELAEKQFENKKADVIVGNNVLAHVPDINDFVQGLKYALADDGVITMEFPHLLQLVTQNQFDTIYHEHFSYLSFLTVARIFSFHGLRVFDVEELTTHGGSLRIYACHSNSPAHPDQNSISELINKERIAGIEKQEFYQRLGVEVGRIKLSVLSFLIEQAKMKKMVVAYGAAAKGNTLINYCGITKELIPFVIDRSDFKQGKYLPGSHIPVLNEEALLRNKPDYIVILPWNLKDEISAQLNYTRKWGCRFVTFIPKLQVF